MNGFLLGLLLEGGTLGALYLLYSVLLVLLCFSINNTILLPSKKKKYEWFLIRIRI